MELTAGKVFFVVYVDDILIFGSDTGFELAKIRLSEFFTTTDLRDFSQFLRIKLERYRNGLVLSQKAYTKQIIQNAGIAPAKPAKIPLLLAHPLYEKQRLITESEKQEVGQFRS